MRKTTKENKKNIKIPKILIAISIILMIIALLIKKVSALRTLIYLASLLIMGKAIKFKRKKLLESLGILFILFIVYILIDGITVVTFKKIPILSYNIITTKNTRVYHSVGIRVWQCDKDDYRNIVVDPFYNKGYICNADDIDPISSNSFLISVVENYDEYKNTYVKVTGKISRKNGQNSIEMQPYTNTDVTVNGQVTFADNITLKILFNKNEPLLDSYDVYDEITVVGIIKNMDQIKTKYVIYMYDTKISSNNDLNSYTISTVKSNKCSLSDIIYTNDKNVVYSYCLDDIVITFSNDNKYEISNALSSNKITLHDLYAIPNSIESNEDDNSAIYRMNNYSVLVCDPNKSNKVVIGNTKMKFSDIKCD